MRASKSAVCRRFCRVLIGMALLYQAMGSPEVRTQPVLSRVPPLSRRPDNGDDQRDPAPSPRAESPCDIVIVGGGAGGVAAAEAAVRAGAGVCLLTESEELGGQLTTVPVLDEHRYIETFGGTRSYTQFRSAIRAHYCKNSPLSRDAASRPSLDPGSCWASSLAFEPRVGESVLRARLRPYEQSGQLRRFSCTRVLACDVDLLTHRIVTITASAADGTLFRLSPGFVLDATEQGDLLPLCGREGFDWVVGQESRAETGEPDAPHAPRPDWVQPLTFPFAVDWSPATQATNVIAKPRHYSALKARQHYRIRDGAITGFFTGSAPWWSYRRIRSGSLFHGPTRPSDLVLVNTPSNDVSRGSGFLRGDPRASSALLREAQDAALGYLYWLQTECPREDDPTGRLRGYPELRLRPDVFGTPSGLSAQPYIREGRRIRALKTVREQEIVAVDRQGTVWQSGARAAFQKDSVGVGFYAIDIHSGHPEEPAFYAQTRPFQIPLGTFIPVRLENLLPAGKNIGTTHLTNGAYRLHPVEWNVGETAGRLAAFCLSGGITPRQVYRDPLLRRAFQHALLREGVPLHWYVDVPLEHPAFMAVQTLATAGAKLGRPDDLLFRPRDPLTPATWRNWCRPLGLPPGTAFVGRRDEAAIALAARLDLSVPSPFPLLPSWDSRGTRTLPPVAFPTHAAKPVGQKLSDRAREMPSGLLGNAP